jgi:hypothetical protein
MSAFKVRLATPAERRGGFGTFVWAICAAGMTRNLTLSAASWFTTSRASNSKNSSAAFSTRVLTWKPQGHYKTTGLSDPMLLPGRPGYDHGRLTPVPGPGADNHDSPESLLLQHPPCASGGRGDYQPNRPGQPDGPDAGLGPTPRHSNRRGKQELAGSKTTARVAWLTRNGLVAHLTASQGSGPRAARGTKTGLRLGRDLSPSRGRAHSDPV